MSLLKIAVLCVCLVMGAVTCADNVSEMSPATNPVAEPSMGDVPSASNFTISEAPKADFNEMAADTDSTSDDPDRSNNDTDSSSESDVTEADSESDEADTDTSSSSDADCAYEDYEFDELAATSNSTDSS